MPSVDVVYQKIHFRHDPRWSAITGPTAEDVVLCAACVIEMMESKDVSCVRKSVALSGVGHVLRRCPGAIKALLLQDARVCLHFVSSLLVLVHLLLELQSEQFVQDVLNDIHTKLSKQASVRGFLPAFTFLGKLVDALPALPHTLACQHVSLLEWLSVGLQYPDQELKASVCYILRRVWEVPAAVQSLPTPLRDGMARSVLHTLDQASTLQLTINCLGLLKQMLQLGEVVSVLMNCRAELPADDSSPEPLSTQHCSLPLVLKKLLLSGDEMLQVASAHCMAAVLVHSPTQYCTQFIQADLPEFLFERLSSSSEALLWSTYGCLLLLAEEPLFFSQCHTVYGIESLVRSLKDVLKLTNLEVQKQGLLLLTVILDRQPAAVRLFPSGAGFVGVAEVLLVAVSSPCLRVATHAARAATALLRLHHQSSPVQYKELKKIVGAVITRCTELPVPITTRQTNTGGRPGLEPPNQASKAGSFLLQALVCFQQSCRLAEQCASEPSLKENAFTAPHKQGKDSLEALCLSLLRCCDTVLIPTVTVSPPLRLPHARLCEQAPSTQVLQHFFSILCYQFTLLPSLMPLFALKLEVEECLGLLEASLPSLCKRVSEWPSLLTDASGIPRATQHCLISLLHIAQLHGDRLLPEPAIFSCMVSVLCSMLEQGDSSPPSCVVRSALYLLAVYQDKRTELDWATVRSIRKALSCRPFPALYTHHPALLHFLFRYRELSDAFGPLLLTLWLSHEPQRGRLEGQSDPASGVVNPSSSTSSTPSSSSSSSSSSSLQAVLEKHPAVALTLLRLVVSSDEVLGERAMGELRRFMEVKGHGDGALAALLRPVLLQLLQRLACHGNASNQGPGPAAPQERAGKNIEQVSDEVKGTTASSADREMDGTEFKLLYHVSNLAGKLKANTSETLLPALNFLYCCLALSPPHCGDRAVSMVLCNTGLMEQIETVHRCVRVDVGRMVQLLCCGKRHVDSLSLASVVRLLQALLDVGLDSPLLRLEEDSTFGARQRPLQPVDSALHPLGSRAAHALVAALHGLLLQLSFFRSWPGQPEMRDAFSVRLIWSSASLEVLPALCVCCGARGKSFNYSINGADGAACCRLRLPLPEVAFSSASVSLLCSALLCSASCGQLHADHILWVLLQAGSGVVQWDPELEQVLCVVERRGVDQLSPSTAQALQELLIQVQQAGSLTPLSEQQTHRATAVLESLGHLLTSEPQPSSVLYP
ncbi:hypothetical protein ACEWY4_002733 [Coilia grayii]|uniref:Meiosis inhibitor protein 1 n=1 Tax=Coilia grayii TaxID=363190 RepID=A0ABD1KP55_9TELE